MVFDVDSLDPPWGDQLRRWREDVKCWSQQELVDQVVRCAFENNEDRGTQLDTRLINRWENGSVGRPQNVYKRLLSSLGAPIPTSPKSSRALSADASNESDGNQVESRRWELHDVLTGGRDGRGIRQPLVLPRDVAPRLQEVSFTELAQVIVMRMQQLNPSVSRRELLAKLRAYFALAAVAPLFDMLDPDEHEQLTRTIQHPENFDLAALRYSERMIVNLRQQCDILGPQLTLHSAIGHRQMVRKLAQAAPVSFRQRAVSAYAELTQLVGWLCFNMGDYHSAQYCYDDARNAAHDAQNVELVTYILCTMSHLATWQGKPRVGIDHAVAAAVWADQAHSSLARAYAADVAVRAYVADNQPNKCRETLDREYAALQAAGADEPGASWWYFYDESFYRATEGECALKLRRPDAAVTALDRSLALVDPTHLHNRSFVLLFQAEARIQQAEVSEACVLMAGVAQLMAEHASPRISQRINDVRGLLTPWERASPVRELDERLAAYRPAGGSGSGNTKST